MPNPTYQYSNGIDMEKVLPALEDRLKWSSEGGSLSGRYFDDGSFHPLVEQLIFRMSQSNASITDIAFETLKSKIKTAAIYRALNLVFDKEEVIDQSMVYHIGKTSRKEEAQTADFVGYIITISQDKNTSLKLLSAVLNFNQTDTVKLYVYEDGSTTPIWEQPVAVSGGGYTIAPLEDCILSFGKSKNTVFYFGYKPSELAVGTKPVVENTVYPIEQCLFHAESIESSFPVTEETLKFPSGTKGLNVEVQSFNDYTSAVTNSPGTFDELIGLVHAVMILEQVLFTQRKNSNQRTATEQAEKFALQMDIMGVLPISDSPHVVGLREKIMHQADKIRKSFVRKKTGVVTYAAH